MTTDPDYLSDEDARRMAQAFWGEIPLRVLPPEVWPDRIRMAWSARPESARRLDEACVAASFSFDTPAGRFEAQYAVNRTTKARTDHIRGHLLEGCAKQKGAGK